MKRNIVKAIILLAVFLVGSVFSTPLIASAATTSWTGTAQVTVTDPLVVSVTGGQTLANGYQFQPVSLKVGETKVYALTVTNTGTTTQMVRPVAVSPSQDITAVWTIGGSGRSIAAGASDNFVLTITAINVATVITLPISFTRE